MAKKFLWILAYYLDPQIWFHDGFGCSVSHGSGSTVMTKKELDGSCLMIGIRNTGFAATKDNTVHR